MTSPTLAYNINARLRRIRMLKIQRIKLDLVIAQEVEALEQVCRQNGESPGEWLSRAGL